MRTPHDFYCYKCGKELKDRWFQVFIYEARKIASFDFNITADAGFIMLCPQCFEKYIGGDYAQNKNNKT